MKTKTVQVVIRDNSHMGEQEKSDRMAGLVFEAILEQQKDAPNLEKIAGLFLEAADMIKNSEIKAII